MKACVRRGYRRSEASSVAAAIAALDGHDVIYSNIVGRPDPAGVRGLTEPMSDKLNALNSNSLGPAGRARGSCL
jgi:hypothetical protein